MKYFLDTEFLEGTQKKWFGETKPTIDLISIGIVAEDGREYYAISKDFNLKEAWNRYDLVKDGFRDMGLTPNYKKVYWLRDNVLKPIWIELSLKKDSKYTKEEIMYIWDKLTNSERYFRMKLLLQLFGKTDKQIAKEIKEFVGTEETIGNWNEVKDKMNTQFYGYYSDYDWVVFCWLFGKMIDLPKGFPMYCIDLKQESDRIYNLEKEKYIKNGGRNFINKMSNHLDYPKQTNEHNALSDAHFNYNLYKFLNTL
jgi:hypothetical protein